MLQIPQLYASWYFDYCAPVTLLKYFCHIYIPASLCGERSLTDEHHDDKLANWLALPPTPKLLTENDNVDPIGPAVHQLPANITATVSCPVFYCAAYL
jgi:hypothetical protein